MDKGQAGRGQPSGSITPDCVLGIRSKSMKKNERIDSDLTKARENLYWSKRLVSPNTAAQYIRVQ